MDQISALANPILLTLAGACGALILHRLTKNENSIEKFGERVGNLEIKIAELKVAVDTRNENTGVNRLPKPGERR
jgi:hypothetical protein